MGTCFSLGGLVFQNELLVRIMTVSVISPASVDSNDVRRSAAVIDRFSSASGAC